MHVEGDVLYENALSSLGDIAGWVMEGDGVVSFPKGKMRQESVRPREAGQRPSGDEYAQGCYFEPTAFAFDDQSNPVCRDEIFGPVISILGFDSDEEALTLANDTEYGLLASLWTQDAKRQRYCIRQLEVGIVTVNSASQLSYQALWGGFKQSGIGRRYGEMGLGPFSNTRRFGCARYAPYMSAPSTSSIMPLT